MIYLGQNQRCQNYNGLADNDLGGLSDIGLDQGCQLNLKICFFAILSPFLLASFF